MNPFIWSLIICSVIIIVLAALVPLSDWYQKKRQKRAE